MTFTIHGKCPSYNVKEKHRNQTVHSVNFNYLKIRTICNTEALTPNSKCLQQRNPLWCLLAAEHTEALKGKDEDSIKVPPSRNLSNISLRWGARWRVVWSLRENSMHSTLPLI